MNGRQQLLDHTNMGDLASGVFGKQIDSAILTAFSDLDDRGNDGQERVVTIKLKMKKVNIGKKAQEKVRIKPLVSVKTPDHVAYETFANIDNRAGGLVFREDAANPDQRTINDQIKDEMGGKYDIEFKIKDTK